MTLDDAAKEVMKILKQVMEEKLSSTNVEVSCLGLVCLLFCPLVLKYALTRVN